MTPCAINDRGQIVGHMWTGTGNHLFLWERASGMHDLGPVALAPSTLTAADINNAGQIVATMFDPNGLTCAFLQDADGPRQPLPTPRGTPSTAVAINDSGQVAGTISSSTGVFHAFFWDRTNGMRDLGEGRALGINNAGQVLVATAPGGRLIDANGDSTGTAIPLTIWGGRSIINNNGWVIGYSVTSTKPKLVTWHAGSPVVGSTLMSRMARGYTINDANQVLFATERLARYKVWGRPLLPYRVRCYLQDPTRGLVPLERYVRPGPDEFFYPVALNNKGCIVLSCRRKSSEPYRAMLLEPIPERWGK